MALEEGSRVKLAADLRLAGQVEPAEGTFTSADAVVGSFSLAAGSEGTVERADALALEPSRQVREYLRLKSLLDDFGSQMPPGSRQQLEEQVGALESDWIAHHKAEPRVRLRVRLDNGFILDDADATLFTPC